MFWYAAGAVGALIGAIYWFYFRDDGKFDEPDNIVIKPPWEYNSQKKSDAKKETKKNDGIPIKLLYYSQTGTAEDFSHRLAEDMRSYGFNPEVLDVEDYTPEDLEQEKTVVFLASTYGEGDPPDNAVQFHEWIMSKDREEGVFASVKYAVFGLGNRTYDNFNSMGREIDTRMEELGAHRFYNLGEGDDDVNIENDFLIWKKGFGTAVCEEFGLPPPDKVSVADVTRRQKMIEYKENEEKVKNVDIKNISRWRVHDEKKQKIVDAKSPFLAKILKVLELHTPMSDRSCLHVEISTHGKLLTYQPGDHLGIYPQNDLTLVHKLAKLLNADLDKIISVHPIDDHSGRNAYFGPCTLKAALLQYYDITSPAKKSQLRVLAQYAEDEEEKKRLLKLSSEDPDDMEIYNSYIVTDNRDITDCLKEFKSVKIPLDHFLEALPKMLPRYYSISSSPNVHPDSVHLTAVLVKYLTSTKREVLGVTTNWLTKNKPNPEEGIEPRIPAFIRKSNFKLPASLEVPIIMVGPGTGLAPFRGFVQERLYQLSKNKDKKGDAILFFGCRHPEHDYIYQSQLETFHKEGALSDLVVAFSRHSDKKVYVQHKMVEGDMPSKIWKFLEAGGHFYVCGDARLMARDVSSTLTEIIMKHGNKTKEEAEAYIDNLQKTNRYMADVWS